MSKTDDDDTSIYYQSECVAMCHSYGLYTTPYDNPAPKDIQKFMYSTNGSGDSDLLHVYFPAIETDESILTCRFVLLFQYIQRVCGSRRKLHLTTLCRSVASNINSMDISQMSKIDSINIGISGAVSLISSSVTPDIYLNMLRYVSPIKQYYCTCDCTQRVAPAVEEKVHCSCRSCGCTGERTDEPVNDTESQTESNNIYATSYEPPNDPPKDFSIIDFNQLIYHINYNMLVKLNSFISSENDVTKLMELHETSSKIMDQIRQYEAQKNSSPV
jgi:hypothetical protein